MSSYQTIYVDQVAAAVDNNKSNNYTVEDKNYSGINPQMWKNQGVSQISADVGGDNLGYIDYTGTTGNTTGTNNDGNAETFTALDGDGSDVNATSNAALKTWLNTLIASNKLTGIGVGSEVTVTSNQETSINPEIQSAVGIGTEDRLLIDFDSLTTTADIQLGLFYGQEVVNWRWNNTNYQNGVVGTDVFLNQWDRASEQMKYQLLLSDDANGTINVNGKKYSLVQDWQTVTSNSGSFAIGTDANTGNAGLQTFSINSSKVFDTIRFAGEDYNKVTPRTPGFNPADVSDYLVNKVTFFDQNIFGGEGDDNINAARGNDTLNGGPGVWKTLAGSDPATWVAAGAQLSADIINDGNVSYINYSTTNKEIFTALDGSAPDVNSGSNATTVNALVNNYGLSGIGVGTMTGSYQSNTANSNPEIQGDGNTVAQVEDGDKLRVTINGQTNSAKVTLGLFYAQEPIQVRQNNVVTFTANLPEQMQYQLFNKDSSGNFTAVSSKQTVTAKNNGQYSATNAGLFTFVVNNDAKFNTVVLSGANYGTSATYNATTKTWSNPVNYPDPVTGTPNNVSDFLVKEVATTNDGNDTLTGGSGADIFKLDEISGFDTIADFNRTEGDVLQISKSGFLSQYNVAANSLSDAQFRGLFSYNATTGVLSFDLDGNGALDFNAGRPQVDVAKIQGNFNFSSTDLAIIA